jgi:uncharacterized RDD family membrane protein YckC
MRCPKCHYLGFEPEPRCKNCGYDFSFAESQTMDEVAPPAESHGDVATTPSMEPAPLETIPSRMDSMFDLRELDFVSPPAPNGRAIPTSPDFEIAHIDPPGRADTEPIAAPRAPRSVAPPGDALRRATARPASAVPVPITGDLPLFVRGLPEGNADETGDDLPLVRVPPAPRAPLAVRRATPDQARLRATYARTDHQPASKPASMDLLDAMETPPASAGTTVPPRASEDAALLQPVEAGQRLMAASVDMLVLGALDGAVLWFTLDVCRLSLGQVLTLPILPMLAFLLLLDGGYLVVFTAACGQTVGKMAAGIRVVGTSAEAMITNQVSLAQATGRALGSMLSIAPLGFGFWFALIGHGRTLHDRLAHTRVVRA